MGDALAGGRLLALVIGSYTCSVLEYLSSSERLDLKNARERARDAVLGVVLGESPPKASGKAEECLRSYGVNGFSWRASLASSMRLAESLMGEVVEGYRAVYPYVFSGYFRLLDKGLTGIGSGLLKAVFEVGLQVDWLLGLPYYPGSTLKGAVRSVAEDLLGAGVAEELFGSAGEGGHVGLVSYADSYPVACGVGGEPCLVYMGDVVSPHYFRGGVGIVESELDVEPNPVVHLAIAPGTVFHVVAGINKPSHDVLDDILDAARRRGLIDSEDKGLGGLARLIARLTAAALLSGFAARSSKGYNILEAVEEGDVESLLERLDDSIERMIFTLGGWGSWKASKKVGGGRG